MRKVVFHKRCDFQAERRKAVFHKRCDFQDEMRKVVSQMVWFSVWNEESCVSQMVWVSGCNEESCVSQTVWFSEGGQVDPRPGPGSQCCSALGLAHWWHPAESDLHWEMYSVSFCRLVMCCPPKTTFAGKGWGDGIAGHGHFFSLPLYFPPHSLSMPQSFFTSSDYVCVGR